MCVCKHVWENEFSSCGRACIPQFLAVFLHPSYLNLVTCKMGLSLRKDLDHTPLARRALVRDIPSIQGRASVISLGSPFFPRRCRGESPLGCPFSDPDLPADPLPKPRGRLAAVHFSPGPRWKMHLHGCDPCTEHLLPRRPKPGAAAADGEGKNRTGSPAKISHFSTLPSASHQVSWDRI